MHNPELTARFFDWFDDTPEVEYKDVAKAAKHRNSRTVYNWRYIGIPNRKAQFAERYMERMLQKQSGMEIGGPGAGCALTLEIPGDKFDRWNKSATSSGKPIRQWLTDLADLSC